MADQRGSRTRKRLRAETSRRAKAKPRRERGPVVRWLWRIFLGGAALALLGALALFTAVYFAARNMPGYSALIDRKSTPIPATA